MKRLEIVVLIRDAIEAADWSPDAEKALEAAETNALAYNHYLADAALAALEARGLCVVPREATGRMRGVGAANLAGGLATDHRFGVVAGDIWTAMIAASQEQQT